MIGEILDAKYRIDRQLGSGGMGNVYLATHLGTTRVVAVKVIAPRWAAEPQFLGASSTVSAFSVGVDLAATPSKPRGRAA